MIFRLQVLLILGEVEVFESLNRLWWKFAMYVAHFEVMMGRVMFNP